MRFLLDKGADVNAVAGVCDRTSVLPIVEYYCAHSNFVSFSAPFML